MVRTLDLSFNKIERVDIGKDSEYIDTQEYYSVYLDLEGNPIKCDCSATDLKQIMDGKMSTRHIHIISDRIFCDNMTSIHDIDYRDLNCPLEAVYRDQNCQDHGCSCVLNKYYSEVTINCSASGLAEFPVEVIQLPDQEFSINLDISDNNIAELPKDANFTNYDNIKVMNFSSNNLQLVDEKLLPRNLQFLSLRDNNIHYLTADTVQFLERHINKSNFHMQLGLNPYDCNCKAEFLHKFINSHHGRLILDRNDISIHCSSGPLRLTEASPKDFCYSIVKKLMPITASIAIIGFLLALFGMLFAFNKQRILIYLYSKSWSRRFFNEEYIDKDKHFDAFISYSHEDREYVEQTLLTGLEEATDSEFRYKVIDQSR